MKNGLVIDRYGSKRWYRDDLLHREDGPDIEYSNGSKEWYYEGKKIECSSNDEFLRLIKLKAFW